MCKLGAAAIGGVWAATRPSIPNSVWPCNMYLLGMGAAAVQVQPCGDGSFCVVCSMPGLVAFICVPFMILLLMQPVTWILHHGQFCFPALLNKRLP
ncbi:hypothetical protein V8C86DRAFT_851900 [Haematococcus lacustris]